MADYRLFIQDEETGEKVCIAKSLGVGWYTRKNLEEVLDGWLEKRDAEASCGDGETKLKLVVE